MAKHLALMGFAALTIGCAAPNTPGSGVGAAYTPVIDTANTNMARYDGDLVDCRRYATAADGATEIIGSAIIGGLLGAAVGSSFGFRGQSLDGLAAAGAGSSLNNTANRVIGRQERIMINCMAGRGYRTLDGAVTVVQSASQIAPPLPNAVPLAWSGPATPAQNAPPVPPAQQATPGAAGTAKAVGQWSYVVERLPESKACHPEPLAALVAKGPGVEMYSVGCNSGSFLSVKCEGSNCRALK